MAITIQPKLQCQYNVVFSCEVDDSQHTEAMSLALTTLSNQAVTVELPTRIFGLRPLSRGSKDMKDILTKGNLVIMFEDDISGHLASAIEMIADHAMHLGIIVSKLANETIIESHRFGRSQIEFMSESVLDCGVRGERFEGSIPSFSKAGVSNATIKKTLAFKFAYAQLCLKAPT